MNAVQKHEAPHELDSKKELIKNIFFKGCTDQEVEVFLHVCKSTGLDPLMKQIYPVKRYSASEKKEVMTCQTSIDGLRLIAERSSKYAPGRESTYIYNDKNELVSATSYVKKMTPDGTWHEIAAIAFFDEYAQKKKEGDLNQFWSKMPHVMLAKCAEAQALRKAFPAELSKIYIKDEMDESPTEEASLITASQSRQIEDLLGTDLKMINEFMNWMNIRSLEEIPSNKFEGAIRAIQMRLSKKEKEGVA
jgi:phage recombination protein Bet